jgi:uncharacterized membrane protein
MATQIAIRGRWDRVRYTLMFEMSLIGMIAPTMAWVLEKGVTNTGLLALVLSLKAMVFNILYNCAFDLVDVHYGRVPTQRSFKGRALHALGFELLLTVTTLPIIIWWLGCFCTPWFSPESTTLYSLLLSLFLRVASALATAVSDLFLTECT